MHSDNDSAPPDADSLHDAALLYLTRYAATETGLRRALTRRVTRWASRQSDSDAAAPMIQAARQVVDDVVQQMVQAGLVCDKVFAESRAKSLIRAGQSNRAVQAWLTAKGVAPDLARSALVSEQESELAAALVLTRKRRVGPFRTSPDTDPAIRNKELALLARAGFARETAEQALDTPRDEAEKKIFDLRR